MTQEFFRNNIQKYIDGELSQEDREKFEAILESCPISKLEFESEQKFHELLKNHMVKEEAPYDVQEVMIDQLHPKPLTWLKPAPVLASIALVAVLTFGVVRANAAFPVFTTSVDSHVEYLKGSYPIEIRSTSVEEVNDWFKGKLEFSINVPDLSMFDAQLVGARLCHLKDKKVAFIMYEKEGKNISVFVMHHDGMRVPPAKTIKEESRTLYVQNYKGYQSVLCLNNENKNTGCVFVSDLPEDELLKLVI